MSVRKVFLLLLLSGAVVAAGACSQKGDTDKPSGNGGLVNFVKQNKLANFRSATIGDAFDSYRFLSKKEWKMEPPSTGYLGVVFSGWFDPPPAEESAVKNGRARKGLEAKFVINADGSFYLSSIFLLEVRSDQKEVRRQVSDIAGILANIYANERLSF